uniref:probable inactive poly [ADP-ribose] polymerase SRO2 n=1 Tax=Fragaria vesca subsp. vesca TaxID=101020 RepID=UPI0005C9BA06|nr:PREDICTED: probable inactive poly [ADP-ribose] polymerase SRO2 [Fragaria vesca subsp. vesca]
MEHIQIATDDYHQEEEVSFVVDQNSGSDRTESKQSDEDSEYCADSNTTDDQFEVFTRNGMMLRVNGLSDEYETILKSFGVGMGSAAGVTEVVAVHKNLVSGLTRRARFETFRVFSQAVGKKCGGNPNIRYAWYSGSRDEIADIMVHGFSNVNADEVCVGWSKCITGW